MTNEEKRKIYAALSAPFPEEAIQRTDGRITGRGYSTVGIGYQHVVNRLNEVLGLGSFRAHRTVNVREVTTAKGRQAFEAICDITVELGEWNNGEFVCWAEALADGGHTATSESDARKGAYTNAFKKACAFFGVGKQAYEGSLDEDNVPGPEVGEAPRHGREREPSTQATHATHATQGSQEASRIQASTAPAASNGGGSVQPLGQPDATGASHASGPSQPNRTRLTSKQSGAIWSMVGKLAYDKSDFRRKVREKYGVQPEFLTRQQASELIGILAGQLGGGPLHSNGAAGAHPQAGA